MYIYFLSLFAFLFNSIPLFLHTYFDLFFPIYLSLFLPVYFLPLSLYFARLLSHTVHILWFQQMSQFIGNLFLIVKRSDRNFGADRRKIQVCQEEISKLKEGNFGFDRKTRFEVRQLRVWQEETSGLIGGKFRFDRNNFPNWQEKTFDLTERRDLTERSTSTSRNCGFDRMKLRV